MSWEGKEMSPAVSEFLLREVVTCCCTLRFLVIVVESGISGSAVGSSQSRFIFLCLPYRF